MALGLLSMGSGAMASSVATGGGDLQAIANGAAKTFASDYTVATGTPLAYTGFIDSWTFSTVGDALVTVTLNSLEFGVYYSIASLDGLVNGSSGAGTGTEFTATVTGGGPHTLTVSGDLTGTQGGRYFGGISVVGLSGPGEVPLPAAAWLFGSALIGLVAVARRKAVV